MRILKASQRRITGGLVTLYQRIKWLYFSASETTQNPYVVHLLVSKENEYSQIARVCVESFLFFHPNAQILIHCDSFTYTTCNKILKRVVKRKKVQIILDQEDTKTWQEQKINLIFGISGSMDIFLDADLKWNGAMILKPGVCFFVEEYIFENDDFYRIFLPSIGLKNQINNSMKNTSFFSWGGKEIKHEEMMKLMDFIANFGASVASLDINPSQKSELNRIVEQLGLSLIIERSDCSFLKKTDSQFDGSFVESSYFGATQTKFGNFGITSRKY